MLLSKLISYKLYRLLGVPKVFPMNLTLGLSYSCNSRCKTCNIWKKKKNSKELSLQEFEEIFKNIGKNNLYLLILTGGEPFLHKDLDKIAFLAEKYCQPSTIVIPTNCILGEVIVRKTKEILEKCKHTHITVNVSLDNIGKKHDSIRGVKGNFQKVIDTYKELKKLEETNKNFDVSIHTVISKLNYQDFPEIYNFVKQLKPSNYITEIAEKRKELENKNCSITPSYEEYSRAIDFLINDLKKHRLTLKQALRIEYYKTVKEIIKSNKQVLPCYAGIASAQIDPTGEVWFCCVRAESIGNIRNTNYNIMNLWYGKKAQQQRRSISNKECYCPLASANYTNIALNMPSSFKVILNILKSRLK